MSTVDDYFSFAHMLASRGRKGVSAYWRARRSDLTGVKIDELLGRRGVIVPCRTVQRYVLEACGRTCGRGPTVRVADGEPGDECQLDFGRMGLLFDPESGRNRVVHALIFTVVFRGTASCG